MYRVLLHSILIGCFWLTGAKTATAAEWMRSGTCFAITNDGHCLTNAHVVEGAGDMMLYADGNVYKATVVAVNHSLDLALVKSDWRGKPLRLRPVDDVVLGTKVWAPGFPSPDVQGIEVKVTEGIISSLKGIHDSPDHYQHSAAIQPGNSGGPLFDEKGAVVGVVVAKLVGDFQNVNYAIKGPVAYRWLGNLSELSGVSQAAPANAASQIGAVGLAVKATAMLVVKGEDDEAPAKAAVSRAKPAPKTSSKGAVASTGQGAAAGKGQAPVAAKGAGYSLSKTGIRHNSTCRFYDAAKACGATDGRPCQKCGG